ncbi:MAG: PIG-L family deacetylase [Verrucomicrobiota bacterium]
MSLILFLSPHLDDAVFSCGARILREREAGHRVVVATIFSRGGSDRRSVSIYLERRAEDEKALRKFGAEPLWLDLADAPFRNVYYRSFREIVLGWSPKDRLVISKLGSTLDETVRKIKPERMYWPLAVGTHIDHRLTFRAALAFANSAAETIFYEDRPYALVRGAVRLRLKQIEADVEESRLAADFEDGDLAELRERFCKSFRKAPYVQRYLPPGLEGEICVQRISHCLSSHRRPRLWTADPEVEIADDCCARTVLQAVRCYRTQIDDFFGGAEGWRVSSREYARALRFATAPLVERYWRLEPKPKPRSH